MCAKGLGRREITGAGGRWRMQASHNGCLAFFSFLPTWMSVWPFGKTSNMFALSGEDETPVPQCVNP